MFTKAIDIHFTEYQLQNDPTWLLFVYNTGYYGYLHSNMMGSGNKKKDVLFHLKS